MADASPEDTCPKCGGELRQTDKNTFTGEVWREYTCHACGHVVDVNEGTALWKILHDARGNWREKRTMNNNRQRRFLPDK